MDTDHRRQERPFSQRLMWFVALYVAGAVVTVSAVYLLRAALFL